MFGFSDASYSVTEAGLSLPVQVNIINGVTVAFPVTIECSKTVAGIGPTFATMGRYLVIHEFKASSL